MRAPRLEDASTAVRAQYFVGGAHAGRFEDEAVRSSSASSVIGFPIIAINRLSTIMCVEQIEQQIVEHRIRGSIASINASDRMTRQTFYCWMRPTKSDLINEIRITYGQATRIVLLVHGTANRTADGVVQPRF